MPPKKKPSFSPQRKAAKKSPSTSPDDKNQSGAKSGSDQQKGELTAEEAVECSFCDKPVQAALSTLPSGFADLLVSARLHVPLGPDQGMVLCTEHYNIMRSIQRADAAQSVRYEELENLTTKATFNKTPSGHTEVNVGKDKYLLPDHYLSIFQAIVRPQYRNAKRGFGLKSHGLLIAALAKLKPMSEKLGRAAAAGAEGSEGDEERSVDDDEGKAAADHRAIAVVDEEPKAATCDILHKAYIQRILVEFKQLADRKKPSILRSVMVKEPLRALKMITSEADVVDVLWEKETRSRMPTVRAFCDFIARLDDPVRKSRAENKRPGYHIETTEERQNRLLTRSLSLCVQLAYSRNRELSVHTPTCTHTHK